MEADQDQIYKDVLAWSDPYGFMSDRSPGRITGNGLMFTGPVTDYCHHTSWRRRVLNDVYNATFVHGGGHKRHVAGHYASHHNAPDDYFGIGLASISLDLNIGKRILDVCRQTGWVLNDQSPGQWRPQSYLGRMPQLIFHLQLSSGESPNAYRAVIWSLALIRSFFVHRKSNDTHRKCWMMVRVFEQFCKLPLSNGYWLRPYLAGVVAVWRVVFFWRFPGGMGEVYLTWGWHPNHPSVKYLWGK